MISKRFAPKFYNFHSTTVPWHWNQALIDYKEGHSSPFDQHSWNMVSGFREFPWRYFEQIPTLKKDPQSAHAPYSFLRHVPNRSVLAGNKVLRASCGQQSMAGARVASGSARAVHTAADYAVLV